MSKHHMFGALLEVAMSKKCTALWREAHFQDKSRKKRQFEAYFEVADVVYLTDRWNRNRWLDGWIDVMLSYSVS